MKNSSNKNKNKIEYKKKGKNKIIFKKKKFTFNSIYI